MEPDLETISIGDSFDLKRPQNYKGYRYVEVTGFNGKRVVVKTTSGWEFEVYADELEEN